MKRGDSGPKVSELQRALLALGFNPGAPDGDYGAKTEAAVLLFQLEYTDVDDDGIAGPQTLAKIKQAMSTPISDGQCNSQTWTAFESLVSLVTTLPVRYGPGRGLWHSGEFVITHGPGQLGSKSWKNFLGKPYASFHCSSWTNFFLGWLLRRNELYTHAGNIPDLFDLVTQDASVHQNPGAGPYRGYGDACSKITPDGSGSRRAGVPNVMDARELLARRDALPTFMVCGQSSKRAAGWLWWHHTVLFVARDRRLFRIAADGYRTQAGGYSGTPMKFVEITDKNVSSYDGAIYRAYGVNTADGSYGDKTKPIARVTIEP